MNCGLEIPKKCARDSEQTTVEKIHTAQAEPLTTTRIFVHLQRCDSNQ